MKRTDQRSQQEEEEQREGPQPPTPAAIQWRDDQSEIDGQIRRESPTRRQEKSTEEQAMIPEESDRTRDLDDLDDAGRADLSYLEEQRKETEIAERM